MKFVVFDVSSNFAHYRKIYTTTSSLTYPFPPRTAICGLISAIVGIRSGGSAKSQHMRFFPPDRTKIAVRLLNPVKKIHISANYTNTKGDKRAPRIQVAQELLKDPAFRIYACLENVSYNGHSLQELLLRFLEKEETYFTPFLGTASHIAKIKLLGEIEGKEICSPTEVASVVPVAGSLDLDLRAKPIKGTYIPELALFRETVPVHMDENRRVRKYADFIVEVNAKPIPIRSTNLKVYRIGTPDGPENIIPMEEAFRG